MITVVGEALVDLIEGPPGGPEAHPGGSPANVAVALARLGEDVGLLTQVGDDPHGRLLLEHLAANGVRLSPGTLRTAAPTSVARTTLAADGQADYAFDVTWRRFRSTVDDVGDCVHTGSIATFLEPGADDVAALLRAARPTATVSYDPNCRPRLMGDRAAAVRRVEDLVALSDVVKVSQEDLAWLYPGRAHPAAGRAWLDLGARLVVVTLGGDGAWAGTAAGVTATVAPEPVAVVDTVGAGDTFTAALLHACAAAGLLGAAHRDRLAGVDAAALAGMLAFASRAAGITCGRRGADPPTLADLAVSR